MPSRFTRSSITLHDTLIETVEILLVNLKRDQTKHMNDYMYFKKFLNCDIGESRQSLPAGLFSLPADSAD